MDSTEIAVYGPQDQDAGNGRFESTCHYPQRLVSRDCPTAKLRPGTVHGAHGR